MRKLIKNLLVIFAMGSGAVILYGLLVGRVPPTITTLLTVLAFVFALLHGSVRMGWPKTLLLVGLTFGVSLFFESVGVATGLIYGPYHYTALLGPMFLGLVPYLIPLAWFMMMYPSFIIAARIVPAAWSGWRRILWVAAVGALVMTAWDLVMDPFMVRTGHWVWDTQGAYFGIPIQNFLGWWLTSFVTLVLFLLIAKPFALFSETSQSERAFDRLAAYSYAITGLSAILTDVNLGLNGPALVGFFAMLPWFLIAIFATL